MLYVVFYLLQNSVWQLVVLVLLILQCKCWHFTSLHFTTYIWDIIYIHFYYTFWI